jgi:hypothetical protein
MNHTEGDAGRSDRPESSNSTEARTRVEGPFRLHCQYLLQAGGPGHLGNPGRGWKSPLPGRERAGTEALEGTAIAENAVAAPEEAGIYPGLHSARW